MSAVVFLRGMNVGGHRTFRPSLLAEELRRYDVVNVGAAGTFVARKPRRLEELRAAVARRLPFDAHVMVVSGSAVRRLVSANPFAGHRPSPAIVPFVSVLASARRPSHPLPLRVPATGEWGLKIVGQQGRFVFGVYRRTMAAIGHLAQIDRVFGVPATTRSWTTLAAVARILERRDA
jgi:uncharacterized protein (DUF1697 family)